MILQESGGTQALLVIDFVALVGTRTPLSCSEVMYNKFGAEEKQNLPHRPKKPFIQTLVCGLVGIN
jgi:hypothetical protein